MGGKNNPPQSGVTKWHRCKGTVQTDYTGRKKKEGMVKGDV